MFVVAAILLLLFFFHATATTELYTYGHTLSLPDALPIVTASKSPTPPMIPAIWLWSVRHRRPTTAWQSAPGSSRPWSSLDSDGQPGVRARSIPRSEEHTSELQSLMRNSYAVYCLKKKKSH